MTDDIKARLREALEGVSRVRATAHGVARDPEGEWIYLPGVEQRMVATIEALEGERDEYKATMEAEVDRLLVIEEQQQAEIARLRARVEVLEEQSRIRQKMLHYIAFVLTGDENGDAQSAADRVQERIEALEGERDRAQAEARALFDAHAPLVAERDTLRAQLAARDAEIARLRGEMKLALSGLEGCFLVCDQCRFENDTSTMDAAYFLRHALTPEEPAR